ncbi:hypothetical protein A3K34_00800 [candidate division WWE3 bacterium RIFOXYC1_FULL_40_10]|uniref:Aminoacyl-tRNA hydrolase n=1 Tax=candidate division WWE3 bacterium RIFOXYA2_FULL_46_9 TaxID=1802636 RepID=A0A1F4W1P9_UNCKA|nr:MAG: hypothetical protein A3K58_00800 [candidate division WWE3 bacterium RIFOXYB1_FULL_40_22]OGC61414.1 MAG: hypothetical protein A3K37_00800 [candidate division WWE3 bacterium RIFOXYA1_FULL_40_11]OGC63347.1 MAG: hypothetical protein A2264_01275 [candidate division WWE3 bacterium RIFOXYA2_FULL_46_9]OGC65404.1 MAG: hypothetical protein A2326_05085 [candidate division WWE3 bacterium RIFOXYB2_FULL_41_6]OGC65797.1 MAG: hypothetical protein A3K34_00800 [candidate division WWE3 bacterium RIFOXYC1_
MKLIVGLGNPTPEHAKNRHNVGYILVTPLADTWKSVGKLKADIAKESDVIFCRPSEFMNSSGSAVSKVLNFYKLSPNDLIVVHDDLDLPFCEVRKQYAAGSAGHKGVQNIIDVLGTKEFYRVRVGIGRPLAQQLPPEEYVLQDFTTEELGKIASINIREYLQF